MLNNLKIWQKFTIFVLALLLVFSAFFIILVYNDNSINQTYQEIFGNVILLNETYGLLEASQSELEQYLTTKTIRSVESFNQTFDDLYRSINSMPQVFVTKEEQIAYNNMRGLLISLSQTVDECISASRGRNPLQAMEYYKTVQMIANEMESTINFLVFENMSASHEMYKFLEENTKNILKRALIFFVMTMLFVSFASITFIRKITGFLTLLTKQSTEIAKHPNVVHHINLEGNTDEFSVLADAFNQMGGQIKQYLDELQEKTAIENELKTIEVNNLSMQNMLKTAELKTLQSQINPHFLFNTLNCIAQTAMLENANESYDLILKLSAMLRYNLRKLDSPVRFYDELANLERYIYIQKVRYGDAISFRINIDDEDIYDIIMPCLSIQPIVENSIIHGFEKSEADGIIELHAYSDEQYFYVDISDNGVGMDENTLRRILSSDRNEPLQGHTTGIGIQNVIYRLSLFYKQNVFSIRSVMNEGTCVTLKIPRDYTHMLEIIPASDSQREGNINEQPIGR